MIRSFGWRGLLYALWDRIVWYRERKRQQRVERKVRALL